MSFRQPTEPRNPFGNVRCAAIKTTINNGRTMLDRELRIELYRQNQPIEELRRKADKARCKSNLWTQEELDLADAEATELYNAIHWRRYSRL